MAETKIEKGLIMLMNEHSIETDQDEYPNKIILLQSRIPNYYYNAC